MAYFCRNSMVNSLRSKNVISLIKFIQKRMYERYGTFSSKYGKEVGGKAVNDSFIGHFSLEVTFISF